MTYLFKKAIALIKLTMRIQCLQMSNLQQGAHGFLHQLFYLLTREAHCLEGYTQKCSKYCTTYIMKVDLGRETKFTIHDQSSFINNYDTLLIYM